MVRHEVRLKDIKRFYDLLAILEIKIDGTRLLANYHGSMHLPKRGVYFFFESGEYRSTSGDGLRVVRVGTHAIKSKVKTKLWERLRTHRGPTKVNSKYLDGGNHRSSVFRKHLGTALIKRDSWSKSICEDWGIGSSASSAVREKENPLEQAVSQHIRNMPFLWLKVDDAPDPDSDRAKIEKHSIALLSNYNYRATPIDPADGSWLGKSAKSEKVQHSGLWNSDFVDIQYTPSFLETLEYWVNKA